MNLLKVSVLALGVALTASSAYAADSGFRTKQAGDWLVRGRVASVIPSDGGDILTRAGNTDTGLDVTDVTTSVIPELDVSYFFTKNIAAEMIFGTTPHKVKATGGIDVGETWVLPPVLTLQYHFMPDNRISPYVGAGVNYTMFFGEKDKDLSGFKIHGDWGWALQAGVDYALSGAWSLNLDVKKVFVEPEARTSTLKVDDVNLNPWIVGVGVGYRF